MEREASATNDPTPRGRADRGLVALGLWISACLALALLGVSRGWFDPRVLTDASAAAPREPRAAALFLGLGFLAEMLWLPRSWGLVAAGALFGPWLGMGLSAAADLGSAAVAYALARCAGRGALRGWLARRPRAAELVDSLARRRGLTALCALRVLPVHWTAVSYAAGLARVPPRAYFGGTALGLLPAAVLFNFAGDALRRQAWVWLAVVAALILVAGLAGGAAARRFVPPASARPGRPVGTEPL